MNPGRRSESRGEERALDPTDRARAVPNQEDTTVRASRLVSGNLLLATLLLLEIPGTKSGLAASYQ